MEETTPTNFRANLFKYLERAAQGVSFKIRTKTGVVLVTPEVNQDQYKNRIKNFDKPKIKGKILGSLDEADLELKKYLLLPK